MATELNVSEDFDLECMCGLIETDEKMRLGAMERIVSAYRTPLFVFVRSQFSSFSAEDAEDIVQGVFVTLWKKVETAEFDGNGSLKSLLFTIAKRQGIDELRKRTALKRTDDEMADFVARGLDDTAVANAWRRAVERAGLAAEVMIEFREFLSRLPEQQALVAEAIYAHLDAMDDNVALAGYIKKRTGKVVTAMMVKGAKQALVARFREILKKKGLLV
jgi:RNA polymerase sigma factor (sigma-70 family)